MAMKMCSLSVMTRRVTAFRVSPSGGIRHLSNTFHDSQSGLVLNHVARDVVRVHELSLKAITSPAALPTLSRARLASAEVPAALVQSSCSGVTLVARVACAADLRALPRGTSIALAVSPLEVDAGVSLIKAAAQVGLLARAELSSAWTLNVFELEDAVARLADAGASVITLVDGALDDAGAADADDVRAAVEAAFGLDVAGDILMSRMSVRGPRATLEAALEAGVTRVDVDVTGVVSCATREALALIAAAKKTSTVDTRELDALAAAVKRAA